MCVGEVVVDSVYEGNYIKSTREKEIQWDGCLVDGVCSLI